MAETFIKMRNRKFNICRKQSGQTMLFTVMVLTSVIIMLSATAGLLTIFTLRHSVDIQATGDAIFAADTGIECAIMEEFGSPAAKAATRDLCQININGDIINGVLDNGATFTAKRESPGPGIITWNSIGADKKGRTSRALRIQFERL